MKQDKSIVRTFRVDILTEGNKNTILFWNENTLRIN